MMIIGRHLRSFANDTANFLRHILNNRYMLYELTRRDFKQKYAGDMMGLAWAVLDPLAMMAIFWLIFGLGFRGGRDMGVPFVAYLITGLASYMCFQGSLSQATGSIKAYSFLLKKVDFRVSILPMVKIFSEYLLHCIVVAVMVVILIANGIYPSLYWSQFLYYAVAMGVLLLGLSWFSSAVSLFFPDINNIISILLRFLFYLTPIFWNIEMLPKKVHWMMKLNPMYYIVTGYRDSFLFRRGFWEEPFLGLYFWGVTALVLMIGIMVFSRLKPHFADVA
jgi:lipopolysaccharide transport system permease protein